MHWFTVHTPCYQSVGTYCEHLSIWVCACARAHVCLCKYLSITAWAKSRLQSQIMALLTVIPHSSGCKNDMTLTYWVMSIIMSFSVLEDWQCFSHHPPLGYWFSSWAQGYNLLMTLKWIQSEVLLYQFTELFNSEITNVERMQHCEGILYAKIKVCALNTTLSSTLPYTEGLNIRDSYKLQTFYHSSSLFRQRYIYSIHNSVKHSPSCSALVTKIPTLYGTQQFITATTRAHTRIVSIRE
jgi:hypothetical protein